MNEQSWTICPGVSEYDSFKSAIGYDIKGVTVCSWPTNTVCDAQCQIWYKSVTQQSDLCKACAQLKWKLTTRKQEHESLSAREKSQRSEATSKYPFEYLSPKSQQLKVQKMRRAIGDLNMLVKRTVSETDRLSLTDEQDLEISELVQSIQSSSEGQELQNIYSKAEQSGKGRGSILQALWENDSSDLNQFVLDQKSNGSNYLKTMSMHIYVLMQYMYPCPSLARSLSLSLSCLYLPPPSLPPSCLLSLPLSLFCSLSLSLSLPSVSLPLSQSFNHIIPYTSLVFSDTSLCQQVVSCYHTNRLVNIYFVLHETL